MAQLSTSSSVPEHKAALVAAITQSARMALTFYLASPPTTGSPPRLITQPFSLCEIFIYTPITHTRIPSAQVWHGRVVSEKT